MPRFEIAESRASEVIDGKPVVLWTLPHSVDTDWPVWRTVTGSAGQTRGLPVQPTDVVGARQLDLFVETR